jgi:NADPH2:quinone reductase
MVIEEFGHPDIFQITDVPEPRLRAGHVLIRVAASSVNPIDWKIRSGAVTGIAPDFPAVLHGDVAGTVEAVAADVERFKPGDEVYACAGGFADYPGALAELMLADADLVAHKPQRLGLEEAAVLPLVSITAWEALIDRAQVQPGQRVLVHAGAGGVGHVGVQLAKNAGAITHTTVSGKTKAMAARDVGADVCINYRKTDVDQYVEEHTDGEGFDVVFDTVGGENMAKSFQAVRTGGTVVTIAARGTQDLTVCHGKGISLHFVLMLLPLLSGRGRAHHGDILTRLARLVDDGRVRPLLDPSVFPFRDVGAAHAKLEAGDAIGKIRLRADF